MQGDSLVSNRSLSVPPTVPQPKYSSAQAQCGADDMLVTGRRPRNEEHGLHDHLPYALSVCDGRQDVDDLVDETPVAAAQGAPWSQWWVR